MSQFRNQPSQSQWALVWREFRKRKLAVVCGVVIVVLATLSVFAPFLANDRPVFYRGVNRFAYSEAQRTIEVVLMKQGDAADPETAIADPGEVVALQASIMRQYLNTEAAAKLEAMVLRVQDVVRGVEGAEQPAALRDAFVEAFGVRNVQLTPQSHWPVVRALVPSEIIFMLLIAVIWTTPIWAFLLRKWLPFPARSWGRLGIVAGVPLLAGALWWLLVPDQLDRTPYKRGRLAADAGRLTPVVYDDVVWPVIPYALDENNLDHLYAAPPFWADLPSIFTREKHEDVSLDYGVWDRRHWMGTDSKGRDLLCRMIWGGRVSLAVGIVAVSIYVSIGILVGSVAGYFRGTTDLLISRFIEIVICFPSFFLILTIVAFIGPSIFNIMVVIGLTGWTGVARLIRGEFLRLAEQEFVLAGRALGYSPLRIIFRHVLPNALAPVLVAATFGVAGAILTESALSFLGIGITAPKPSWGGILAAGRDSIFRAPWLLYFPGLAIFITITAYNLVGEAFRDAADPRLRGSQ